MTPRELVEAIPTAKAVWALFGAIGGAAILGYTLPSRIDNLEDRVQVLERVGRYQGCRSYFSDTGKNPADCAGIYRDLEDFLVDPALLP